MMTRHRRRQAARRPDALDRLLDQVEGGIAAGQVEGGLSRRGNAA